MPTWLPLPSSAPWKDSIGHGTSSATGVGVGLTLHHTWGVPLLPGSALKGLTAQYVQTVYCPELGAEQPEREPFRGTNWKDSRPVHPPGAVFRRLFGAPEVDELEACGSQGAVTFHDALWVPAEGAMLARDVLTVHQRAYYEGGGKHWPVDYDDPNPVSFLTVAPAQRFFVALEARGDQVLLEWAARYLCEALESWGVGGKTVAGYGRFVREAPEPQSQKRPAAPAMRSPESPSLKEWRDWVEEQKARQVPQRQQFQQVEWEWTERLLTLTQPEKLEAARLLKKALNLKREDERQRLDELLARLRV